jgi:glutamine amidotransferase
MEPVVPEGYKVPHIGWNALHFPKDRPKSPIFRDVREGDFVYFVHTYYGTDCSEAVIATTEYGPELTAAVSADSVYGLQFHPEKSGETGMKILKAFCDMEG